MKHDLRWLSLGANLLLAIAKINLTLPKYSACKKMFNTVHFFPLILSLKSRSEAWNSAISQQSDLRPCTGKQRSPSSFTVTTRL